MPFFGDDDWLSCVCRACSVRGTLDDGAIVVQLCGELGVGSPKCAPRPKFSRGFVMKVGTAFHSLVAAWMDTRTCWKMLCEHAVAPSRFILKSVSCVGH